MLIWAWFMQGWGVAVLVGVPNKDDSFKTNPINLLNERTLKGTFFGNYKPRTDIPGVVEKYMKKVEYNLRTIRFSFYTSINSRCSWSINLNSLGFRMLKGNKWFVMQELEVEKFITHKVNLSDINKAFDYMMKGESLRCVINMDAWILTDERYIYELRE